MSYAALNALVLTLTAEKADLEFQRSVYDQRRQTLAFQHSNLSAEYSNRLQMRFINEQDQDATTDDSAAEMNWDQFLAEYTAAQEKLDSQDKILELESKNIETKTEAINTLLEGAIKQRDKNVENDHKSTK